MIYTPSCYCSLANFAKKKKIVSIGFFKLFGRTIDKPIQSEKFFNIPGAPRELSS